MFTTSSPVVKVIMRPLSLLEKSIVSPLFAAAIWARNDPEPLSAMFVTVSVPRSARLQSFQVVAGVFVANACAVSTLTQLAPSLEEWQDATSGGVS